MIDLFISYSSLDEKFAKIIYNMAKKIGFNVFMASTSLKPGDLWSEEILDSLSESETVIFLASKESIKSTFVLQEVGSAITDGKWLIPILLDITPEELPGWSKDYYAIDFSKAGLIELKTELEKEMRKVKISSAAMNIGIGFLIGTAYDYWKNHYKN